MEQLDDFGLPVAPDEGDEPDDEQTDDPGDGALPELARLEWEGRWGGEKFTCWAEFRDPYELTGKDLDALRKAAGGGGTNRGDVANRIAVAALTLLISKWDIPYVVGIPVPRDSRNPAATLQQIGAWDRRKLEAHVTPLVNRLLAGPTAGRTSDDKGGPGSPPTPERG